MSTSGSIFSRQSNVTRKQFWIWICCLLAAKIALVVFIDLSPQNASVAKPLDTVIVIFIATTIGARFNDIGWRRWLGIAITLVIMIALPLVVLFAVVIPNDSLNKVPAGGSPLDVLPWYVGWSSTACLVVLLAIAGSRPSRGSAPTSPQASGSG